jgi:hypothetical protein
MMPSKIEFKKDILSPAAEVPATAQTAGSSAADMPFEIMQMMMPHSLPTRCEGLDQNLEALLNNGWSIIQASGASPAATLVLKREQQHVICALIGNMPNRQTGRSDPIHKPPALPVRIEKVLPLPGERRSWI